MSSFLPGGEAARGGFRFEDWVILEYLSRILRGEVSEVEFEGQIPTGIEARVTVADGLIEHVQCKTRSDGRWTISRLDSEGVLNAMFEAVRIDAAFKFFSNQPNNIDWVCDRAREVADEDWIADSEARSYRKTITSLSTIWGLDDPLLVKHTLAKVSARVIDLEGLREKATLSLEGCVRAGAIQSVIPVLLTALSEHGGIMGGRTTRDRLVELISAKVEDWEVSPISDLGSAIEVTAQAYFAAQRFDPDPLSRPEARSVADLLASGAEMVTVTGPGGYGKSAILAEVIGILQASGHAVCPIDARQLPESLDRLAEFASLRGWPEEITSALGRMDRPVLVLDQLDSVAPGMGGSHGRWAIIQHMIAGAIRRRIRVVVGCRPINGLTNWVEIDCSHEEVRLGEWETDEMLALTGKELPLPPGIPLIPVMGALWLGIPEGDRAHARNAGALLDAYREDVRRRSEVGSEGMTKVEATLASELERNGNVAPRLGAFADCSEAVERLVSAGYLQQVDGGVSFRHEVVGEHAWASSFDRYGRGIEELLEKPALHLHRRLRDYLQFLANGGESRSADLAKSLRVVVRSDVRPALVATALNWISSCPRDATGSVRPMIRDETLDLETSGSWRWRLAITALRENAALFEWAANELHLDALARSDGGRAAALWICRGACDTRPDLVVDFAVRLAGTANPARSEDVPWWRPLALDCPQEEMIAPWIKWIEEADDPDGLMPDGYGLNRLAKGSSTAAFKLLGAWLRRHQQLALAEGKASCFSWDYQSHLRAHPDGNAVSDAFAMAEHSNEFVELCGSAIVESCRSLPAGPASDYLLLAVEEIEGSTAGRPMRVAGALIANLLAALTRSGEAPKEFLASHGHHFDDSAIGFSSAALCGIGDIGRAVEWVGALANSGAELSGWSRNQLISMIGFLEEQDGAGLALQEAASDWGASQELFAIETPGLAGPLTSPNTVFMSGVVRSPFSDEEVSSWSDSHWTGVLRAQDDPDARSAVFVGGAVQVAGQLKEAAKKDPGRFLALLAAWQGELLAEYVEAILDGAVEAEVWVKAPLPDLEISLARFAAHSERRNVIFARVVRRGMESEPTPAERDVMVRLASVPTTPAFQVFADDGFLPADLDAIARVDCIATEGVGMWINRHLEDLPILEAIVQRAIASSDSTLGVACLLALRWVLPISPARADALVRELLERFPELEKSIAVNAYMQAGWRRGWTPLVEYWTQRAAIGPAHPAIGERWAINRMKSERFPTVADVEALVPGTHRGVAEVVANVCKSTHHMDWSVPVLRFLLSSSDSDVAWAARRWEFAIADALDEEGQAIRTRERIPKRLLELIPPTVALLDRLMDSQKMLEALAAGTSTQATEACRLASGLLPQALPETDLAVGWDVASSFSVATAAYETLCNEGSDPGPALDLLDELIIREPVRLSREVSGMW